MKLFIVAALVAVTSAARLDHLERGYLPPSQNNYGANSGGSSFPSAGAHGNFGFGNQGSQYGNNGANGIGSFSHPNDFVGGSGSNGFGPSSNGFGGNSQGSNSFGSNGQGSNFGRNGGSSAATSNQYLPPNYGSAGSNGGSNFGSSIRPSCSTCGSNFGSPQRYQSFNQNSIPSTQYGRPAFGSSSSFQSPQSSFQSPQSSFQSQPNYSAQQDESVASRQYLAPKTGSTPQQPFDENTGYIY